MSFFRKLFFIFLLASVSIMVLFFSQRNNAVVNVDFIFWQSPQVSVWFLTFVSFLAGSLVTILILFIDIIRVNVHESRLRKENRLMKEELLSIRNQDIDDVSEKEDIDLSKVEMDKDEKSYERKLRTDSQNRENHL